MSGENLEKGPASSISQVNIPGEAGKLVSGTETTVANLLNESSELSDDQKMIAILNKLDGNLKAAQESYEALYGQSYGNIQGIVTSIEYGGAEGLQPNTVELQTIFGGLQGPNLSDENIALFKNLQSKFMEKSPETQARMLWFFELVNDYVVSKSNNLSIDTNPLKNVLFSGKDIPYKQWITGIFEHFEKDESRMIALSESIRSAEAPQIGLKQFIRKLFDTKPEVMEEADRAWLQTLYTTWPDEQASNKPGTISNPDKKERDRIAKKYLLDHSERGTTTPSEIVLAQTFRSSLSHTS